MSDMINKNFGSYNITLIKVSLDKPRLGFPLNYYAFQITRSGMFVYMSKGPSEVHESLDVALSIAKNKLIDIIEDERQKLDQTILEIRG